MHISSRLSGRSEPIIYHPGSIPQNTNSTLLLNLRFSSRFYSNSNELYLLSTGDQINFFPFGATPKSSARTKNLQSGSHRIHLSSSTSSCLSDAEYFPSIHTSHPSSRADIKVRECTIQRLRDGTRFPFSRNISVHSSLSLVWAIPGVCQALAESANRYYDGRRMLFYLMAGGGAHSLPHLLTECLRQSVWLKCLFSCYIEATLHFHVQCRGGI